MRVWVVTENSSEGAPKKVFDSLEKAELYLRITPRSRYLDLFIYEMEVE